MKRISTILLTLVLTVSMLVPEFSMLPAVYAEDETPAAVQTVDGYEDAGEEAVSKDENGMDTAADEAASCENDGNAAEAAAADEQDSDTVDQDVDESGNKAGSGDFTVDESGEAGLEDSTDGETVDLSDEKDGGDDVDKSDTSDAGDIIDVEDVKDAEEPEDAEEPDSPEVKVGSYDKLLMTDLYDAGVLVIPEAMQDKIKFSKPEYGNGLLLTGTIEDLNSTYITLKTEFDFDSGSIGRIYFDGLKDKNKGMSVEVEVYLDGCKSPQVTIPLKKQMGKKEWANKGDTSLSLGTAGLTGKHKVDLLLKISGIEDTTKKTSVMLRAIQFCKTTVPVMYFNIDESEGTIEAMNASEDHSVECYGTVDLVVPDEFNADDSFRDEYKSQDSLYNLDLEYIRGRGNSTWMDDKKPYKVKFDKAQNLFGFGKNKHWILLANRYDNSLIRNRMTYWLGRALNMEFTPECVPVEVIMNGEYYGSYLLCEQIRVGKGRVTIDDLDDIKDVPAITDPLIETGGYLLSMEWADDEKRSFVTKHEMQLYIESPDDNVAYFNDYIKAFTQKVENAIFSADFKDSDGHPYTDYLDMDAAVDYWWIQEFSENGDAYGSGSTYLYKKRAVEDDPNSGKLYWGPLWDFDFVAWGDLDYSSDPSETLDYTQTPWFEEMKSDPEFIKKVKNRWLEEGGLRDKLVEITKKGGLLDKYIKQMTTTYDYDHELWGPYESDLTEYSAEVEQLRGWINKRIEYVDGAVAEMSTDPHNVTFKVDGKQIAKVEVIGVLRDSDFPEVPKKKGYVFYGWIDDQGFDYGSGARITEDLVLNAFYMKESDIVQAKNIYFRRYDVYYPIYENYFGGETIDEWFFPEYRVMPDDAFNTDIKWSSSNENIAEVDDGGSVHIIAKGTVTITAKLSNGVSRSYKLHIIDYSEVNECEQTVLNKTSVTLKEGEYTQVLAVSSPQPCDEPELIWVSTNEDVAVVDDIGVITAIAPGTAEVLAVNTMTREVLKCKITVKSKNTTPKNNVGKIVKRKGNTYKITRDRKGDRRAMLIKAKNAKSVTIPAYIKLSGKKYRITKIKAKAFAKSKATKVTIKTKRLVKTSVKGSLKGSKVKKIYVKVGKKKDNKKFKRKYKRIFTKKNAGKKVEVK